MTTRAACRACGTEPLQNARFCHNCGSPVDDATTRAEFKQVTVLFADVVHSMDIAAAVGAERLREIMTELVNRATAVVQRYGGTVDKFTGTASWQCSAHQWPWKTTPFVPVVLRRAFTMRPSGWPPRSKTATVRICSCGWDSTPVR
jgi:hypothetical protein